jgi:flagellar protein FlgJ
MEIRSLAAHVRTEQPPQHIQEAAQQFEALLVGQLLKAARSADGEAWLGGGSDSSATPAIEFAEEQLAAALSARGGLGLAAMIAQSLQHVEPGVSEAPGEGAASVR